MKLMAAPLLFLATTTLAGQTAAHAPVHRTAAAPSRSTAECARLPEVSAKIPALPSGNNCANVLYTMRVEPPVKIEYVSPLEGAAVEETLGISSRSEEHT